MMSRVLLFLALVVLSANVRLALLVDLEYCAQDVGKI
jgi:hypothetical protein